MRTRLPIAWLIGAAAFLAAEGTRPPLAPGFAADIVDLYAATPSLLQSPSFWCFAFAGFYHCANLTAQERLSAPLGWLHLWLATCGWALVEAAPHLLASASMPGPQGSLDLFRALDAASFAGACMSLASFATFVGVVLLMLFGAPRDRSAA